MSYAHLIKSLSGDGGADFAADSIERQQLFAAMLDGGVPELELGALIVALAGRPLSISAPPCRPACSPCHGQNGFRAADRIRW